MIYLVRTVTSPDVLWSFQSDITADVIRGRVSFLKVFPISNRGVLKTPWLMTSFEVLPNWGFIHGMRSSAEFIRGSQEVYARKLGGVSQTLWLQP